MYVASIYMNFAHVYVQCHYTHIINVLVSIKYSAYNW